MGNVSSYYDISNQGGKMKLKDVLHIVGKVLFVLLALTVIYMLLQKITGHSPTVDQINFALLSGIITVVVLLYGKVRKLEGEFKHLNKKVDAIGKDLKEVLLKKT